MHIVQFWIHVGRRSDGVLSLPRGNVLSERQLSVHRLSGWVNVHTCCIRMPIFVCGQHLLRQWPFILLVCPRLQQLL
jgi:hypothetical protein